MLGIRTAAPSPQRWFPAALKRMEYLQRAGRMSESDPNVRLVPIDDVYRLQGSAVGAEVKQWKEIGREMALPAHAQTFLAKTGSSIPAIDQQGNVLLRVKDARLAFQLSALPQRESLINEAPHKGLGLLLLRFWWAPTDWENDADYSPSKPEQTDAFRRTSRPTDTEPWFLDRAKFDKLFPLDRSRYRKK